MYKSIILPLAKEDIKETAIWYNKQQSGVGLRFTHQVRKKIQSIRTNPYSYAIRYSNVRCAILDVFPFMIHFIISEETNTIVISAVLRMSRNPDIWNKRI